MKKINLVFFVIFSVVFDMYTVPSPQDWRRYEEELKADRLPGPRYAAQVNENCNHNLSELVKLLEKKEKTALDFKKLNSLEQIIEKMGCSDFELLVFSSATIPANSPMNQIDPSEKERILQAQQDCCSYITRLSQLLKQDSLTPQDKEELSKLEKEYQAAQCNDSRLLLLDTYTMDPKRYDFRRRSFCSHFLFRALLMSDKAGVSSFIHEVEERKKRVEAGLEVIKEKDKEQYEYNNKLIIVYKQVLGDTLGAWDPSVPLTPEQEQKFERYLKFYGVAGCADRDLFRMHKSFSHDQGSEVVLDSSTKDTQKPLLSNAQRYDKQRKLGWLLPEEYVKKIHVIRNAFRQKLEQLSGKESLTETERQAKSLLESVVEVVDNQDTKTYEYYDLYDLLPTQAELESHDKRLMELWHSADRTASERRIACLNILNNLSSLLIDTTKSLTAEDQKTIEISIRMLKKLECVAPELLKQYRYVEDEDIKF